jgi:hypothetical protein
MKRIASAVLSAFLLLGLTACGNPSGNDRVETIHVTDKERVCDSNSDGSRDCQYLIYTDEGTYKNVDSILNGKHNSSDLYGKLKRDHAYSVKVEGYRSGWQSEYPNIIEIVEEVENTDG